MRQSIGIRQQVSLPKYFGTSNGSKFGFQKKLRSVKILNSGKALSIRTLIKSICRINLTGYCTNKYRDESCCRLYRRFTGKGCPNRFDAFEAIHAKSYSYIFTTLCTNEEIDELFEWVKKNEFLQYKANKIADIYNSIEEGNPESLWKAMFSSVMLESFLFYSGFFYPLYLGGQGFLRNSAEIISLILRDESIHGVAVGFLHKIYSSNFQRKSKRSYIYGAMSYY